MDFVFGGLYSLAVFLCGLFFGWGIGSYLPPLAFFIGSKKKRIPSAPDQAWLDANVNPPHKKVRPTEEDDPFMNFVMQQIPEGVSQQEKEEIQQWLDHIDNPIGDWTEQ